MTLNRGFMSPAEQPLVEHEVEVVLLLTTTHTDIESALRRSGVEAGFLIGEALITDVRVYSPDTGPEVSE